MTAPPFPHDPVRYPDLPSYAGHERWRGHLRLAYPSAFYDLVFDPTGHDRGDEDRA